MSDDAERIRRQMQDVRQDMGAEVKDIVLGAKQLTDWRYYVRHYPWMCVGGAFALGFLAIPGRRRMLTGKVDVQALVEQLKNQGLAAAPLYPGGIAGKLLAVAGPFLLKNAANMLAQRFHGSASASDPIPNPPEAP